jgi:apolipoprotein D and lipocalin family protein
MQFIWPIKADFRIIDLDRDYQTVIIGRQKRDYVWIMSRSPQVGEETWSRLLQVVADAGYDLDALRRVPHRTALTTRSDQP